MKTSLCRKWKIGRKIYYFDSGKEYETEIFARTLHEMIGEIMEEEGKKSQRFRKFVVKFCFLGISGAIPVKFQQCDCLSMSR